MWTRGLAAALGTSSAIAAIYLLREDVRQRRLWVLHADSAPAGHHGTLTAVVAPAGEAADADKHGYHHRQRSKSAHLPTFDTNASFIEQTEPVVVPHQLKELQLRNVQVFFRHGARSPLRILTWLDQPEWPKKIILGEPSLASIKYKLMDLRGEELDVGPYEQMYQNIVFKGGTPAGQLTKVGKLQVYDLGQRLRREYVDEHQLIKPAYKASEVYVRSTNMLRTIDSAKWLLSGLYGSNRLGEEITIFAEPAEREILYPNHSFCLKLKIANKKLFRSIEDIPGLKEDRLELQQLLDYNEDANNKRKLNYVDLRDEISARQAHGLPVPKTVLSAAEKIEFYAVAMLTFMVSGSNSHQSNLRKDIMRLACGPVLHLVRDNIDSSLNDDSFFKLQLYACHDSMLMALLVTLRIFHGKWPPFAADLTVETFEDKNGDAWVRVLYCGQAQRLPGCQSEFVPLDQFKTIIAPYVITFDNYREECQAAIEEFSEGEFVDVIGSSN